MGDHVNLSTVIDCCRSVNHELGASHSEACYHKAVEVELRQRCLPFETEVVVPVYYKGHCVGSVRPDLVIAHQTVVELKAVPHILPAHRQQLLKYMRLMDLSSGLVVNMGKPLLAYEEVTTGE